MGRGMPVEIARKFIVHRSVLALCRSGTRFIQGYLYTDEANTIRIRQTEDRTLITWKRPRRGACRDEIELALAPEDGAALLVRVPAGAWRNSALGSSTPARSGTSTSSAGHSRGSSWRRSSSTGRTSRWCCRPGSCGRSRRIRATAIHGWPWACSRERRRRDAGRRGVNERPGGAAVLTACPSA